MGNRGGCNHTVLSAGKYVIHKACSTFQRVLSSTKVAFPPAPAHTGSVLCLSHRACPELEMPLALAQEGIWAAGGGAASAHALSWKHNVLALPSADPRLSPQPGPGATASTRGVTGPAGPHAASAQPKCSNSLNPNSLNLKSQGILISKISSERRLLLTPKYSEVALREARGDTNVAGIQSSG